MQEILFRGKRKDNGEWVEGCFLETNSPEYRCFIVTVCSIDYDSDSDMVDVLEFHINDIIPETVGQYTGKSDKNGKKIFEGDIIRYECDNNPYPISEIISVYSFYPYCEIIGNIYDNPELLEVSE